ncbi:hypothetical protein [Croceiramulus getboli]|nr:hypothetical protein P8624_13645 [Flavobacteriaceae bacterium YJPT1-3]
MKHNAVRVALLFGILLGIGSVEAQQSFRKDSVQFKMYTSLWKSSPEQVDSIVVRRIFCKYCTEAQRDFLKEEAVYKTFISRNDKPYRKEGEHKMALYIRISKEDFKNLNTENNGKEGS